MAAVGGQCRHAWRCERAAHFQDIFRLRSCTFTHFQNELAQYGPDQSQVQPLYINEGPRLPGICTQTP